MKGRKYLKICLICNLSICALFSFSVFSAEDIATNVERNPFLSPIEDLLVEQTPVKEIEEARAEELLLSGTLRTRNLSTAIINNAIVKEGETISGFKVVSIERKSVILSKDGERYILRMGITEKGEKE